MSDSDEDLGRAAAVATALARALTPADADLVACTAETARAAFGAAACSIALLTEDGSELVFTTAAGGSSGITGLRLPASEGIAGWVATTGQPIAVGDLASDPRFAASFATSTGYVPRAIIAAPIETETRLVGVIEVLDRDESRAGAEEDLGLLVLFGRQAAVAIEAQARSWRIGEVIIDALGDEPRQAPSGAASSYEMSSALLGDVAAAFGALASGGPDAARLATTVLTAVTDFTRSQR